MKKIIITLSLLWSIAYAQCDSISVKSTTNITATSAQLNWTAPAGATSYHYAVYNFNTNALVTSGVTTATFKVITGLTQGLKYKAFVYVFCAVGPPSGTVDIFVPTHVWTTVSDVTVYTPQKSTQFTYLKADSGVLINTNDTLLRRQPNVGGLLAYKASDSSFYGYNGVKWNLLAAGSPDVSNKVDSVTISGSILYYWVNGVSHGMTIPSAINLANSDLVQTDPYRSYDGNGGELSFNNLLAGGFSTNDGTHYGSISSGAGNAVLQAYNNVDKSSTLGVTQDSIYLQPAFGVLGVDSLALAPNMTNRDVMVWNKATGRITHISKDSIGGLPASSVNIYNSNGALTANRVLDGNGHDIRFDIGGSAFGMGNNNSNALITGTNDDMGWSVDGTDQDFVTISLFGNRIIIDGKDSTILSGNGFGNLSSQSRLVGQSPSGRIGYTTIGSGLSLSSGVLSATPTYKVYTATITQTGTSAPVATVLENTLGGTVVWSRVGSNNYVATLSGAFTTGKTFTAITPFMNYIDGFFVIPTLTLVGANSIQLKGVTTDGSDMVDGTMDVPVSLEIRVYY